MLSSGVGATSAVVDIALFTGIFAPDGLGDGAHLIHLFNAFKSYQTTTTRQLHPVIFMMYYEDKKATVINYLRNNALLSKDTLDTDSALEIHKKNADIFLISLKRDAKDLKNDETPVFDWPEFLAMLNEKILQDVFRQTKIVFNISNSGMLEILNDTRCQKLFKARPRVVHFPEHGCAQGSNQRYFFDKEYPMGLEHGLFLEPPDTRPREEILCSLTDATLLSDMLGCEDKINANEKLSAAKTFFAENFFFPCYYKFKQEFDFNVWAVLGSPLCMDSGKKGIVVYTNIFYHQQDTTFDVSNPELLTYMYDYCRIKSVTVITKNDSDITKSNSVTYDIRDELTQQTDIAKAGVPREIDDGFATLKIINKPTNPKDFQTLFTVANGADREGKQCGLGGACGDKSWEVLTKQSIAVVPGYRGYKYRGFSQEMSRVFPGTHLDKLNQVAQQVFGHGHGRSNTIWHVKCQGGVKKPIIEWLTPGQVIELAKNYAKHITLESVRQIQTTTEEVIKNRNLYKLLPGIFSREIQAAYKGSASVIPFSSFKPVRKRKTCNTIDDNEHKVAPTSPGLVRGGQRK